MVFVWMGIDGIQVFRYCVSQSIEVIQERVVCKAIRLKGWEWKRAGGGEAKGSSCWPGLDIQG